MEKLRMTNNEYQEYIKGLASKVWTDENYTMKQYCEDCDNVEIIPFDLARFNLPSDIEENINIIFHSEYIAKDGVYTLKGFSHDEDEWYKFTYLLNLKRPMGYYYSGYCYNDEYNFYMDYCEGDLWLKLFTNREDYERSLAETIKWYEDEEN